MEKSQLKIISVLSVALAILLIIISYSGVLVDGTYERDSASMAAQGIGQDFINLFFVVPLLVVSLIFVRLRNKISYFIYGGIILYILYSSVIYSFGVHFNRLFLIYCLTLGISMYTFIIYLHNFNKIFVESWFNRKTSFRLMYFFLLIIAVLFYTLWLRDVLPAILNSTVPLSVSDNDLLVNPVHVLDISIALPGLIITAILLSKKHRLGYILGPICLIFLMVISLALIAMVLSSKMRGINEDMSITIIFIIIAMISLIILVRFLANIPKTDEPNLV